jgi:DNA invertase Pin-like site-specific DNA recombinase
MWNIPLRDRPRGRDLDRELSAGDHVIFPALSRTGSGMRDLAAVVLAWRARGIAVHFADDELVQAGADLSESEIAQVVATAMKFVRDTGRQRRRGEV